MTTKQERSQLDRTARRAVLIDGLPVITLGGVALALGSTPDLTDRQQTVWIVTSVLFTLSVAWVLFRSFRRADEYQRKVQLESMAIAFGAVMVSLQIAGILDAAGIGQLRQSFQLIVIGGIALWLLVADLRTRFAR